MPDHDIVLRIDRVAKAFGGLAAIDGVSIDVMAGERLGIAGPNGSGKSTLFNVVSGIPYGPDSGRVYFRGRRIDRVAPHRIVRLGLARTFQKDAEFADLTPHETVGLASVYGNGGASEDALDLVEFDPGRRGKRTSELSVYEKKLLMIASAMVVAPAVLMLDEPASGLTRPEISKLDALLLTINHAGVTVILIEHVLGLLLSVAERLIVLDQGRILAQGDPEDMIADPRVIEAYLGGTVEPS